MRDKYPADDELAKSFAFPRRGATKRDSDLDLDTIEHWCAEGCPLYC
jgi:hypothetical protein